MKSITQNIDSSLILSDRSKLDSERIQQDSVQVWSWINQPTFSKNTKSMYVKPVALYDRIVFDFDLAMEKAAN